MMIWMLKWKRRIMSWRRLTLLFLPLKMPFKLIGRWIHLEQADDKNLILAHQGQKRRLETLRHPSCTVTTLQPHLPYQMCRYRHMLQQAPWLNLSLRPHPHYSLIPEYTSQQLCWVHSPLHWFLCYYYVGPTHPVCEWIICIQCGLPRPIPVYTSQCLTLVSLCRPACVWTIAALCGRFFLDSTLRYNPWTCYNCVGPTHPTCELIIATSLSRFQHNRCVDCRSLLCPESIPLLHTPLLSC